MSVSGYAGAMAGGASTATPPRSSVTTAVRARTWILSPSRDLLLIVAAPVLVLAIAVLLFGWQGAATATTLILLSHVVMTVAHHMPTFIRIYGDVELFKRHRWTFVLAPLIPFGFAMAILGYINIKGYPVENVLVLFLILTLWDPYHFLMQHYGFTRIYDRHNGAPPKLAARMDLVLSGSCFIAIMLLCADWVPEVLEDLYVTADLPLIFAVPAGLLPALQLAAVAISTLAAAAYALYVYHCWRQGWRVSAVKIALYLTFFSVMALCYTPNAAIQALAPGWTFKVGFAVVGIVHMTQYLAIVWKYNRNLARQPDRARAGFFARIHAVGGWWAGSVYVAFCLIYGAMVTSHYDTRWLMSVLLALGFTSTLLHYYFDGFIWKVRHRQNRENLDMPLGASGGHGEPAADAGSWWTSAGTRGPAATLFRHFLYFGIPMAVLTYGALTVWQNPRVGYLEHVVRGQALSQAGRLDEALSEAEQAVARMQRQLPLANKLAELQPTAARETELAFLIYDRARFELLLIPTLKGEPVTAERERRYRAQVELAAARLDRSLGLRGSPAHPGREGMTADDARRIADAWREEIRRIRDGLG